MKTAEKRYHKNIYFNPRYNLQKFCDKLNKQEVLTISEHARDNLIYYFGLGDLKNKIEWLQKIKFVKHNLYEFYIKNGQMIKAGFKLVYNQNTDLILVVSRDKTLVTVFKSELKENYKPKKKHLYATD